jgi:guanylate kinase
MKKGLIIVIAGPSGSGKNTVTDKLLELIPNSTRVVTTTTRQSRPGEVNGRDYFFLKRKSFLRGIKEKKFLEYTRINNPDNYYGTRRRDFETNLKKGKIVFFNCDFNGLRAVRKFFPEQTLGIFLSFEKLADLKKRILARDPKISKIELTRRVGNAKREMEERKFYDRVVVNRENQLAETVERARKIISHFISTDL